MFTLSSPCGMDTYRKLKEKGIFPQKPQEARKCVSLDNISPAGACTSLTKQHSSSVPAAVSFRRQPPSWSASQTGTSQPDPEGNQTKQHEFTNNAHHALVSPFVNWS